MIHAGITTTSKQIPMIGWAGMIIEVEAEKITGEEVEVTETLNMTTAIHQPKVHTMITVNGTAALWTIYILLMTPERPITSLNVGGVVENASLIHS